MALEVDQIAAIFNARAETYAGNEWHRRCAERLVELAQLRFGDRVLDAGTGTGFAAFAAARVVGERGRVIGVDVSSGMLRQASVAMKALGLTNVELVEEDAARLVRFASGSFDAVLSATGLFYMPILQALQEWRRLLKPRGLVGFSTVKIGSPLAAKIFRDCAREFGLSLPDPSEPLGTAERCRAALVDVGFEVREIVGEQVEFSRQDLALAWESNFRSAGRSGEFLSIEDRAELRDRYVDALARYERENPGALWHTDVLYSFGRR